jgi:shikimate kinase
MADSMTSPQPITSVSPGNVAQALGDRNVVFIGLMGAGKTAIGRKVASRLGLPFTDSDHEIEEAARMAIPDLFEQYGEQEFRALEERVMQRLLKEGNRVISTGGGAFINPGIREAISQSAISVWLKADLDTLMARVAKRKNRPLLNTADPRAVMQGLMSARYPIYAMADITVTTRDAHRDIITSEVLEALAAFLNRNDNAASQASSR